jgi:hypothetical protein
VFEVAIAAVWTNGCAQASGQRTLGIFGPNAEHRRQPEAHQIQNV